MSANLSITDNANSTGTATIAGAVSGDISSVYYSAYTGEMKSYNRTLAGSITENGSLALSLGAGHFLFQAVTSNAGNISLVGNVVYQNLTDGQVTIHRRILDAAKVRHDSIGFNWLPTSDVLVRFLPNALDNVDNPFPKVYIAPLAIENYNDQLLNRDDPGFPFMVILVDAVGNSSSNQTSGMGVMNNVLDWRIRVSRAFRNQRLAGVSEVYFVRLEPLSIVDVGAALQKARIVSALAFRAFVRETRGLS